MYDRIASPDGGPKYAGGCSHHMAATFIFPPRIAPPWESSAFEAPPFNPPLLVP